MTRYVEQIATPQMIPPWNSPGASTWLFVLEIDVGAVNTYLDYFSGAQKGLSPAPYSYRPLLPQEQQYAFLTVTSHPSARSVAPDPYLLFGSPGAGWNRMKFTEVSLSIPLLRTYTPLQEPYAPILTEQVWVEPFVWYDSPSMVFSAREIWGADSEYMKMCDHEGAQFGSDLHLDTAYVGVEVYSPYAFNELLAALHVMVKGGDQIRPEDLPGKAPRTVQKKKHLLDLVGQRTGIRGGPEVGSQDVVRFEQDSLKQFRSAEEMDWAIYRALVSSHVGWRRPPSQLRFHPTDQVNVDFMWSAGLNQLLVEFLGLKPPKGCNWPQWPPSVFSDTPAAPLSPSCECGPPRPHEPVRPPPPKQPGKPPQDTCWDLYRLPAKPVLCLSYLTDLTFHVQTTRHVYRLPT